MSSNASYLLLNQTSDYFFSGHKGGLIISWDLETGKNKTNLNAHKSEIKSLHFANINIQNNKNINNLNLLVSGSADGKVKIWDLRSKSQPISLKGHLECVNCVSLSPDLNYIASGANDSILKLWDLRQNKLLKDITNPEQREVNCVEFNPYCTTIAYGSSEKTVKHWDLERLENISVTPFDKLPAQKLSFDSSGRNLFIVTNEGFKYFMVDDEKPEFIDMYEAGFNNLQDICYRENEGLYGILDFLNFYLFYLLAVSVYSSRISKWFFPEEKFGGNKIDACKRSVNKIRFIQ